MSRITQDKKDINLKHIERFGEKLKTLRNRHDITLTDLAHRLGMSAHGYISEIESGKKKPTVEFVVNVASIFNVTTDSLLIDELNLE